MSANGKGALLLVAPDFYDYHIEIVHELERQGYQVTYFPERPVRLVYSLAKKLPRSLRKKIFDGYLSRVAKEIQNQKFDSFLLIRGEIFTPAWVSQFKHRNPEASTFMYQWDSMQVCDYRNLVALFDRVMSFDEVDAKALSLEYLPLFYHPDFRLAPPNGTEPYDLVFVGSYNEERYQVLCKAREFCRTAGLAYFHYLYISPLDYIKLLLKRKAPRLRDINFRRIDRAEILGLYRKSKAILDIENFKQTGLTMRTFEALATGRKFVTTNTLAPKLLPGLEGNIIVADREQFFFRPQDLFQVLPLKAIIESHSLPSWVACVMRKS